MDSRGTIDFSAFTLAPLNVYGAGTATPGVLPTCDSRDANINRAGTVATFVTCGNLTSDDTNSQGVDTDMYLAMLSPNLQNNTLRFNGRATGRINTLVPPSIAGDDRTAFIDMGTLDLLVRSLAITPQCIAAGNCGNFEPINWPNAIVPATQDALQGGITADGRWAWWVTGDDDYDLAGRDSGINLYRRAVDANLDIPGVPTARAGIEVTALDSPMSSEGGGTTRFTVNLRSEPRDTVTVQVTSTNSAEGIANPATLTFTRLNWFQPQTVTVTGQNDTLPDGSFEYAVLLTPRSGDSSYNTVTAKIDLVNSDDEPPAVAPALASQPISLVAQPGEHVTFRVTATGTPAPTYQWLRDGLSLAGQTQPVLDIPSVQAGDAGSYAVQVSNTAGSIMSRPAVLSLAAASSDIHVHHLTAVVGSPHRLEIRYQILGTTSVPSFSFGFFRSADARFDAGDTEVGQQLTVSAAADRTVGLHTMQFSGSGYASFLQDTAVAFFLVQADMTAAVAEADETNNDASFVGVYRRAANSSPLVIRGRDGADRFGETADDTIRISLGSTISVSASFGQEPLNLPAGNVSQIRVFGHGGSDILVLQPSGQVLSSSVTDSSVGGVGKVVVHSGLESIHLLLGTSADNVDASQSSIAVRLVGGDGNDLLTGGTGPDTIEGGSGDDSVAGGGGNDLLVGGLGKDTLSGGAGDDAIRGGPDADQLAESPDNNLTLTNVGMTGLGNDALDGIEQARLTGGAGNNMLNASAFTGSVTLDGAAGNDTLLGGPGDDAITGGPGDDSIAGGLGLDRLVESGGTMTLSSTASSTTLSGLGADALVGLEQASLTGGTGADAISAETFTGSVTLVGGAGNDTLTGGSRADRLMGEAGNDSLVGSGSGDTLSGGVGHDTLNGSAGTDVLLETGELNAAALNLMLSSSSMSGLGTDMLSNLEQASLIGSSSPDTINGSNFSGPQTLVGGGGNDTLTGGSGADCLAGGDGNDSLAGGSGNDTLAGGSGNDNLGGGANTDRLLESADVHFTLTNTGLTGLGTDTLSAIEEAALTGGPAANTINASAFTGPTTLDGGAGNDSLVGGSGNDNLRGGAGNDTLNGGAGTDRVVEFPDATVTVANFTLSNSSLSALGTDTLTNMEQALLQGGAGNDTLNAAAFAGPATLDGLAGDDSLTGGSGMNSLRGQAGNDTLSGGTGNDTLEGGADVDRLVESAPNANAVTTATLTDSSLTGTLGTDSISGIEQASLVGGSQNDTLSATVFSGVVTLIGGDGNDTITGGNQADCLVGGSGTDAIGGRSGDDSMSGGAGNDTLDGGPGIDLLAELGDNNFTLTNTGLTGLGTDSLSGIERAMLTGGAGNNNMNASSFGGRTTLDGAAGNDTLSGGGSPDQLSGGAGNDSLSGGGGNDTLSGAAGNDTLAGGNDTDRVIESADANLTLTNSSLTGGLGTDSLSSIEQAALTGGAADNNIQATGFSGPTTLDGGAGNDSLAGGSAGDLISGGDGNDFLTGQAGDDVLLGGAGSDRLIESATSQLQLVLSNTYSTGTLGADLIGGVEQASLTGSNSPNALSATAFAGPVTLIGGSGSDTLTGGPAADSLVGSDGDDGVVGGPGDDSLTGGAGNDLLMGNSGIDRLIEQANVSFTLTNSALTGLGMDTLSLVNEASLTGGPGSNRLVAANFNGPTTLDGAAGDDSLTGGPGPDSLLGGTGNDQLRGGDGDDTIEPGTGSDSVDAGSGEDGMIFHGTDGDDRIMVRAIPVGGRDGPCTVEQARAGCDHDDLLVVQINQDLWLGTYDTGETVMVFGGAGNDRIEMEAFAGSHWGAQFHGGLGDDLLGGAESNDSLDGGPGNDTLHGGAGNDLLRAQQGDDRLVGGPGNDRLAGHAGDDQLRGRDGDDTLLGGDGNDTLGGGDGMDTTNGMNGHDHCPSETGGDTAFDCALPPARAGRTTASGSARPVVERPQSRRAGVMGPTGPQARDDLPARAAQPGQLVRGVRGYCVSAGLAPAGRRLVS